MTTSTPLELLTQFVSLFEESLSITVEQMRAAGVNSLTLHGPNGDLLFRTTQVVEAARDLLARGCNGRAAFEITQDGEFLAGTDGPREAAYDEAMRYASQYQDTGPVEVNEVIRVPVLRLSGIPRTPVNPEECYHLQSRVYRRPETAEWVLEIEGMIGTCHVTSRHTQPLHLAPEDVPGLPSRHGTVDPLGEYDIYEIAEKFSTRDYTHDYPATIYDIVREVERRLQEQ